MNKITTLSQFLIKELSVHPEQYDLIAIMSDLATIGKIISSHTNRAGVADIIGSADKANFSGDDVKKFDIFCNDLCKNFLISTGRFAAMASEEEEGVVEMGENGKDAKYIIAFDPLDGSHNLETNMPIGTIFSVQKRLFQFDRTDERQFLQPGKNQVLAGYLLYSSSTILVFSWGDGVYEFTLDQGIGEFILSREKIKIPDSFEIYSFNEAASPFVKEKDKRFLDLIRNTPKMSLRYAAAMVADVHRNILKGGIFMHPAVDKKGDGNFKPKLRLNYEAKPMAFIAEQAGAKSSDGEKSLLEIAGESLHEKTAVYIGNKTIIEEYLNF